MNIRWILSITIALTIHILWLHRSETQAQTEIEAQGGPDLIVAAAEPLLPPPAQAPPQADPPPPPETETPEPERFRPNIEPEENETDVFQTGDETESPTEMPEPEVTPETEVASAETPEPEPEPIEAAEPAPEPAPPAPQPPKPKLTKKEIRTGINQYRKQLIGSFNQQYTQVPELRTKVGDQHLIPQIDRHFGITTLAYSFVDHKPGPPFLLFEETHHQKLDSFDFSQFSNRIKDRMLYTQYRTRLQDARQQHGINALMKMIGLVPAVSDRYFSAKQLRAVELAGLSLDRVQATNAHYEPHGADGFTLIVDSVVTKEGRIIPIQDEELKYSISQDS